MGRWGVMFSLLFPVGGGERKRCGGNMSGDQPGFVNQTNLLVCSPVLVKTSKTDRPYVSIVRILSLNPVFDLNVLLRNKVKFL